MRNGLEGRARKPGKGPTARAAPRRISFEAKFALGYILAGLAWICFDHDFVLRDPFVLKDVFFVLMSACLFYVIAREGIRRIRVSEAALAEGRERMAKILETAASALFVLDRDGVVTFANRAAEAIFGVPPDRMVGMRYNAPDIKALTADGQPFPASERPFVRAVVTGRPVHDIEYVIERPDGTRRTLSVNAAPLRDRGGTITGVVASVMDITERKRLDDLNVRKFSMTVEQSPVAIAIAGRGGRVEYVNPSFTAMTGYSVTDLPAGYDVFPTGESAEATAEIRRALCEGSAWTGIIRSRRKSGELYWESVSLSPIVDNEGRVCNFLWLRSDITERRRTEEELRESEERFRQIFEQNEEPVVLFRAGSSTVLDANAAALALYGFSWDEFVGGGAERFTEAEVRADFDRMISGIDDGRPVHVDRATHVRRGGGRIIVSIRGKCMKLRGGTVAYVTFRDITERIRLEEDAKVRHAQLIHASRIASLGTLVSGVAHEINNPNNLIMFNAPMVREAWRDIVPLLDRCRAEEGDFLAGGLPYSEMRDALPRMLDGIGDASRRIKAIVENLKEFAAQDRSSMDRTVDVNASVKIAVDILRPEIGRRAIRFDADFEPSLPAIRGCAQHLEQVVLNLMMNALQAVREPSRGVRIATRSNPGSGCVEIHVEDEGIGMSDEAIRKIGEPFYTTRGDSGGLGLGLSISLSIVKAHGGVMTFRSEPGRGTSVVVSLPAASARAA